MIDIKVININGVARHVTAGPVENDQLDAPGGAISQSTFLPIESVPLEEALTSELDSTLDPAASEPCGIAAEVAGVSAETYAGWIELVERIRSGRSNGMEELYQLFSKGIRFYLCRQLGSQELDDKVHDTFLVVVQAIRRGELREPERLMGFVRTIVRRQVAAHIDKVVHTAGNKWSSTPTFAWRIRAKTRRKARFSARGRH